MLISIFHYVDFVHSLYMDLIESHCGLKMLLVVMLYVWFRQFCSYDLYYLMFQWFKCSGSIYMMDDSFLNNDYSHNNTKYNVRRIKQCYEIYWYSINDYQKNKKWIAFIFNVYWCRQIGAHQIQKNRVNMLILTV